MPKNQISTKFTPPLSKTEWGEICPDEEYRGYSNDEAKLLGLFPQGMSNIVGVVVSASGSINSNILYTTIIHRNDNEDRDHDPCFVYYEKDSENPKISGMIHHADFKGRTVKRDSAEYKFSSEVVYNNKPNLISGTLEELRYYEKIYAFILGTTV